MSVPIPDHIRDAAIADYLTSDDTYATVAARYGISRSRLHALVNPDGVKTRRPKAYGAEELAYKGGWHVVRGIQRPLYPSPRRITNKENI